jgi:hypothetical protein
MTKEEVIHVLQKDILLYTAAIHWNVARSAYTNSPPKIIYVNEFIEEICSRILNTFDPTILNKRSVIHLAHWYTEHMIREQYGLLVNRPHDS